MYVIQDLKREWKLEFEINFTGVLFEGSMAPYF